MHGERGSGGEDEDKVIRLPRDWLGPRDELVPFGPSADRSGRNRRECEPPTAADADHPSTAPAEDPSVRPPLEEVGSRPADPVSPDDFWGERSAALQGPLDAVTPLAEHSRQRQFWIGTRCKYGRSAVAESTSAEHWRTNLFD